MIVNIIIAGLKFLVRICTDLGLKDAQDYANKLKKAEKTAKLREEVLSVFNSIQNPNII